MTPFFIGWAAQVPAGLRRALAIMGCAVLGGLPAAGLLLGLAAGDPADTRFAIVPGAAAFADLPQPARLQGVLLQGPYPLLHLPADAVHPRGRTLLLAGDGKSGGSFAAIAHGTMVSVEGAILRRGSIEMLVSDMAPQVLDATGTPPAVTPLGRWRIQGEICDGKCAAGGMRPGIGLAHRACATLCLSSEIPAVFVASAPVLGQAFLLLAHAQSGRPVPAFRDLIGQRLTLEGAVERVGDMLVFHAERP